MIGFNQIVTHDFSFKDSSSGKREIQGIVSAEIADKVGEVAVQKDLLKGLNHMLNTTNGMSIEHSNKLVGKWTSFEPTTIIAKDGTKIAGIVGKGYIHEGTMLADRAWELVKNGTLKGLSFGGATRSKREPAVTRGGKLAYLLKDTETYEVCLCRSPMNPWAVLTNFNSLAKSITLDQLNAMPTQEREGDHDIVVRCKDNTCYVNQDADIVEGEIQKNNQKGVIYAEIAKQEQMDDDSKREHHGKEHEGKEKPDEDEEMPDEEKEKSYDTNTENDRNKALISALGRIIDKIDDNQEHVDKAISDLTDRIDDIEKKTIPAYKTPANDYVDTANGSETPKKAMAEGSRDSTSAIKKSEPEPQEIEKSTPEFTLTNKSSVADQLSALEENPILTMARRQPRTEDGLSMVAKMVKEDHFNLSQFDPRARGLERLY